MKTTTKSSSPHKNIAGGGGGSVPTENNSSLYFVGFVFVAGVFFYAYKYSKNRFASSGGNAGGHILGSSAGAFTTSSTNIRSNGNAYER